MVMMVGWGGGFFLAERVPQSQGVTSDLQDPKSPACNGVVSFPLLSGLKATNRICKSLGKANIIGYNILKALLIYSCYASG